MAGPRRASPPAPRTSRERPLTRTPLTPHPHHRGARPMTDECPFCAIVARSAPAQILGDWGHALAIVPLHPVTPGHVLVLPAAHVTSATDSPEVTAMTMRYAAKYAREHTTDCNIITSVGDAATQTVRHLHIHVVPRRADDGLALPWTEQ